MAAIGLLFIAFFLNLGIHPLSLEEPRRALIALEMYYNHNLWVPTEFGEYYYKKPPFYNWLILGSYQLFGVSEFSTRFFSTISHFLVGWLGYRMGTRYVDRTFGVFTAMLYMVSVDILFYFSLVGGEIDLFYSLVTFAGFLALFHFYKEEKYVALFVSTYFLGAIGTLTKGLPSVAFLGISLLVFFIYQKDFRRLFSFPHLLGMLTYLFIVGGYLWSYSRFNSVEGFFGLGASDSIVNQSLDRTFLRQGLWESLLSFVSFPFLLLKILIPASLFTPFLLRHSLIRKLRENEFVWFGLIMLGSNILVYWLSPGTRSRYLYMFIPFAVNCLFFVYYRQAEKPHFFTQILEVLMKVVMAGIPIICLSMPFIPGLEGVNGLWFISIGAFIGFGLLSFSFIRLPSHRLILFLIAFMGLRIVFDLTILPVRAQVGNVVREKELAYEIVEQVGQEPLNLYGTARPSRTTIFYLEKELRQVIGYGDSQSKDYILAKLSEIDEKEFSVFLTFEFKDVAYGLVRRR